MAVRFMHHKPSPSLTRAIAATAAGLVVEDGLDYGSAKIQAARILGAPRSALMPGNDQIEEQVQEYIRIFCANSQAVELRALRELALSWMERLAPFRPHVSGAVWNGTATRNTDIHLQLFCDDSKSAEIELINQALRYQVNNTQGFNGRQIDVLSLDAWCAPLEENVGVHLGIYDHLDFRGALLPARDGLPARGNATALRKKLCELAPSPGQP